MKKQKMVASKMSVQYLVFGVVLIVAMCVIGYKIYKDSRREKAFQQNQQCLQHKENVERSLKDKNTPYGEYVLVDIFFSPVENECFYAYEVFMTPSNPNFKTDGFRKLNSVIRVVGADAAREYAWFDGNGYNELTKTYFYSTIEEMKKY